jgi:hypothetical protein
LSCRGSPILCLWSITSFREPTDYFNVLPVIGGISPFPTRFRQVISDIMKWRNCPGLLVEWLTRLTSNPKRVIERVRSRPGHIQKLVNTLCIQRGSVGWD